MSIYGISQSRLLLLFKFGPPHLSFSFTSSPMGTLFRLGCRSSDTSTHRAQASVGPSENYIGRDSARAGIWRKDGDASTGASRAARPQGGPSDMRMMTAGSREPTGAASTATRERREP